MQDAQNRFQLFHRDLSGGGNLTDRAEGHTGAEGIAADAGDDPHGGHTHGEDGAVCVLVVHFLRRVQQGVDVRVRFWHDRDLRDIRAVILHDAEAVNDVRFFGSAEKIVVGADYLYTGGMDIRNIFAYNGVAGEYLHINQIHRAAVRERLIQSGVGVHGGVYDPYQAQSVWRVRHIRVLA